MKEYWVNVYKGDYIMGAYYSRDAAINWSDKGGVAYRIHVKMKEPEYKQIALPRRDCYGRSINNWMD